VFGPATAAPAARTTAAVRAASAPTIDGKLDEPEWTAAPWTGAFTNAGVTDDRNDVNAPASVQTRFKLLHL